MDAPEHIYIFDNPLIDFTKLSQRQSETDIEYTRTDAFIEKACEFLKDHLAGYDIYENDVERSIESFKLAMEL